MDPRILKSMQAASGAGGKGWEILSYTDKISQTRNYTNSITGNVTPVSYTHLTLPTKA